MWGMCVRDLTLCYERHGSYSGRGKQMCVYEGLYDGMLL